MTSNLWVLPIVDVIVEPVTKGASIAGWGIPLARQILPPYYLPHITIHFGERMPQAAAGGRKVAKNTMLKNCHGGTLGLVTQVTGELF